MKKIIFIFLLFGIYSNVNANTYIETKVNGKTFKVVEYDIKSEIYDIEVLKTQSGSEKSLMEILDENNAITGVNGVFFCPSDYSFCKGREGTTNNERYVKGEKFNFWPTTDKRAVFAWDKENNPFIFQTYLINPEKESDIEFGLSNWPLLLLNGKQQTEFYRDYGLIDEKMKVRGTRNFVCSNQDADKIYFGLVYGVNIDELAVVLKDFGCYNALNLDAGLSTAFAYNGRYLVGPQRDIIDAIGIVPKFDTTLLNQKSEIIAGKITAIIDTKHPDIQLKIFDKYLEAFSAYRTKIYTSYSKNIYDEEGNYLGYKLDVNNQKALERIYLINKTQLNLKKYRIIYKEMIDELNYLRQEKIEQNKKNLQDGEESIIGEESNEEI